MALIYGFWQKKSRLSLWRQKLELGLLASNQASATKEGRSKQDFLPWIALGTSLSVRLVWKVSSIRSFRASGTLCAASHAGTPFPEGTRPYTRYSDTTHSPVKLTVVSLICFTSSHYNFLFNTHTSVEMFSPWFFWQFSSWQGQLPHTPSMLFLSWSKSLFLLYISLALSWDGFISHCFILSSALIFIQSKCSHWQINCISMSNSSH